MKKVLLLALLACGACATPSPAMEEVRADGTTRAFVAPPPPPAPPEPPRIRPDQVVVSKTEPGPSCRQLGTVQASWVFSYDQSLSQLREKAAKQGANFLVLDYPTLGRAYACPPACQPECSPGYACVEGACVSACNPACGHGEACGPDRLCHPLAPAAVVLPGT
jgi:hypothetical protein